MEEVREFFARLGAIGEGEEKEREVEELIGQMEAKLTEKEKEVEEMTEGIGEGEGEGVIGRLVKKHIRLKEWNNLSYSPDQLQ